MKVYVASSWRNTEQPAVVEALRRVGHEVYDFRNPAPEAEGFRWSAIDPDWQSWSPERFREALEHPLAIAGETRDREALEACEACVLILPCGRSAHLELGYAIGAGKRTAVLLSAEEPELMYRMVDRLCLDLDEVLAFLSA